MKKFAIIAVILLIVGITIWYFVYAKKDQDKLDQTVRKINPQQDEATMTVIKPAKAGVNTPVKKGMKRAGANTQKP